MHPDAQTPPAAPPPIIRSKLESRLMLEPDEHIIRAIKRHPIGLVFAYLQVFAAFGAIVALALVINPNILRDLSTEASFTVTIVSILLLALLVLILFLITNIYWQNKLVLTDQAVLQVLQAGPFQQKVSRLDFADIQDVTSEQKGLLPTIFNYGTLNVETAGEQKNFMFKYASDPQTFATQVIEARHNADTHSHHPHSPKNT